MQCSSDVLKKTSPLDVFGDVSEKVKHLTNDASNNDCPPALHDVHFDPYVGNSSCDFPKIQVLEEGGYSGRDVMFCIL